MLPTRVLPPRHRRCGLQATHYSMKNSMTPRPRMTAIVCRSKRAPACATVGSSEEPPKATPPSQPMPPQEKGWVLQPVVAEVGEIDSHCTLLLSPISMLCYFGGPIWSKSGLMVTPFSPNRTELRRCCITCNHYNVTTRTGSQRDWAWQIEEKD